MRRNNILFVHPLPTIYVLILLTLAFSCSEKVPADDSKAASPNELHILSETSINGTEISRYSDLAGLVLNSATGEPIAGLPVTDGHNYVVTDDNGIYQMTRNSRARKVYYSTPSEYRVELNKYNHSPKFYSDRTMTGGEKYRVDFTLTPLEKAEDEVTFIMVGDPQCPSADRVERYKNETIKDIISAVEDRNYPNVYAFTLGDIIFDSNNTWSLMQSSMSNVEASGRYIPFFQTIGNHDHDAGCVSESDDKETRRYNSVKNFNDYFGPHDYSFNRANVHVVVLDNVIPYKAVSSSKSNGQTCTYGAGLFDYQYDWLRKDLSYVKDKENTILFVCVHIPLWWYTTGHHADILELCKDFKEAHIMSGHTHYSQNYIYNSYVCKGGQPVYEHIHGSACGAWWTCNSNTSGAPNGYTVYTVKDGTVYDWQMKGTGHDFDYQLRVYDGNQTYSGKNGYLFNWYNPSNKAGSNTTISKGNSLTEGCFVVEFFDDDDRNCSVEFYQNGAKVGDFTRLEDGSCANIALCSYFLNELNFDNASDDASHYWYFKPESENPAGEKNWEVRATRKIPTSGVSHTYCCSSLTTDYSVF